MSEVINLYLWTVSTIGAVHIICSSKIFNPIRNIFLKCGRLTAYEFLTCPMCIGFWIGSTSSMLYNPFEFMGNRPAELFYSGLYISLISHLSHVTK